MLKLIAQCLRWMISVALKFFRVVPWYTTFVVFSTLVSQVSLIVAFFLPLKVLILLGSTGMPRYFPPSWQSFERDELAITLSLSAAGFYILYLIADRLIASFSTKGAFALMAKANKIILFENQDVLAVKAYHRFSRGLSRLVFFTLSLITMAFLYPFLSLVIVAFIVFLLVLIWLFSSISKSSIIKWNDILPTMVNIATAVGFLCVFAYMVADFLVGQPANMIVAVVCLLLARQCLNSLGLVVVDFNYLYINRVHVSGLFFHGSSFSDAQPENYSGYFSLLDARTRNKWILKFLNEVLDVDVRKVESTWLQDRRPSVTTFIVQVKGVDKQSFLVKLYDNNRKRFGIHEASLGVKGGPSFLPAFDFISAGLVEGFQCNVFSYVDGMQRIPKNKLKEARVNMAAHLISFEPDTFLVKSYKRSHPMLFDRIRSGVVGRLRHVLGEGSFPILDDFDAALETIVSRLSALPLQIVCPDIKLDMLYGDFDGGIKCLHWGRWQLEPVGSGWPIINGDVYLLEQLFPSVSTSRLSMHSVSHNDVQLAALSYAFDDLYTRELYTDAIELIPIILQSLVASEFNCERDVR